MSISIDESEWRILFTAIGEGRQTITKAELVDLLDSVGARLAGGEIEQLYRKYDADGSGDVSFEEFLELMTAPTLIPLYPQLKRGVTCIPQIRVLHSVSFRIQFFARDLIHRLLTTGGDLEELFFDEAPKIVSKKWLYFFGISQRVALFAVFMYFFVTILIDEWKNAYFISLDNNEGCLTVPKPSTVPSINADYLGNWQGQLNYQDNLALYSFSFSNFMVEDNAGYNAWMRGVQEALRDVGSAMMTQDLSVNLLYWSSWKVSLPTTEPKSKSDPSKETKTDPQTLTLLGSPTYIMLVDSTIPNIANVHVDCNMAQSSFNYDFPTATLEMFFSYSAMMMDPSCNATLNPYLLGYNPLVTGDVFQINLDANSLFSALVTSYKVNGPLTMDSFITIDQFAQFKFRGVWYQVIRKYDSTHADMAPIYCLGPKYQDSSTYNCLLKMGNSYVIPFLTHAGSGGAQDPIRCQCSAPNGHSATCDEYNLISGALVYDYSKNASYTSHFPAAMVPFLPALEFFYIPPVQNGSTANYNAFSAAWAATIGYNNSKYNYKNPTWRKSAYEFGITASFGYPAIVAFHSYTSFDASVSPNKYQLRNGACADSVSTPYFDNFIDNPWVNVTEPYYECLRDFSEAFVDAAGIGAGNAGLIVPGAFTCLMYLCVAVLAYLRTDDFIAELKSKVKGEKSKSKKGTRRGAKEGDREHATGDAHAGDDNSAVAMATVVNNAALGIRDAPDPSYVKFMRARRRELTAGIIKQSPPPANPLAKQCEFTDQILREWKQMKKSS